MPGSPCGVQPASGRAFSVERAERERPRGRPANPEARGLWRGPQRLAVRAAVFVVVLVFECGLVRTQVVGVGNQVVVIVRIGTTVFILKAVVVFGQDGHASRASGTPSWSASKSPGVYHSPKIARNAGAPTPPVKPVPTASVERDAPAHGVQPAELALDRGGGARAKVARPAHLDHARKRKQRRNGQLERGSEGHLVAQAHAVQAPACEAMAHAEAAAQSRAKQMDVGEQAPFQTRRALAGA